MALTLKQINDICMIGTDATQCRYLADDDGKYFCLKLISGQKAEIDKEIKEFIKKHKDRGVDPNSMGLPLGNNCGGYRFLTAKMQGYDIDGKVP
jgi:hypothetical protein